MTQEEKQLLLIDLCARLPHHVRCKVWLKDGTTEEGPLDLQHNYGDVLRDAFYYNKIKDVKPYLRPMSSMTKKEATELVELSGFKNILSVKVNQDHIIVEVDDGVCSSERHTIWFNEIVSSIKILDWLLKNHFDYRGLIEKGLALEAPEDMYKF